MRFLFAHLPGLVAGSTCCDDVGMGWLLSFEEFTVDSRGLETWCWRFFPLHVGVAIGNGR